MKVSPRKDQQVSEVLQTLGNKIIRTAIPSLIILAGAAAIWFHVKPLWLKAALDVLLIGLFSLIFVGGRYWLKFYKNIPAPKKCGLRRIMAYPEGICRPCRGRGPRGSCEFLEENGNCRLA